LFKVLLRRGCLDEPSLNEVTLKTLTGIHPLDFETLEQITPDRCVPTLAAIEAEFLGGIQTKIFKIALVIHSHLYL
jgi:hypothetical protein